MFYREDESFVSETARLWHLCTGERLTRLQSTAGLRR
jgi:hypothetical protein